jgi:P-type Ca2+ transporter type 2C
MQNQNNQFASEDDRESVEAGLTFVGIFGLQDPLRPGIPQAVKQCQISGINVRMVTGDNIDTAISISRDAGIIH